jgi:hypothetical protein
MAAAKKNYARTKQGRANLPKTDEFERACFIEDVLDGTVEASGMEEIRNGQGRLIRIEYDDPSGAGLRAEARRS